MFGIRPETVSARVPPPSRLPNSKPKPCRSSASVRKRSSPPGLTAWMPSWSPASVAISRLRSASASRSRRPHRSACVRRIWITTDLHQGDRHGRALWTEKSVATSETNRRRARSLETARPVGQCDAQGRRGALPRSIRPISTATRFVGTAHDRQNTPGEQPRTLCGARFPEKPGDVLVVAVDGSDTAVRSWRHPARDGTQRRHRRHGGNRRCRA